MKNSNTILVVDDHPMTVDSYINLLSDVEILQNETHFIKSFSSQDAFNKINLCVAQNKNIDLAILDINLPTYEEHRIYSGIELAKIVKDKFPECKLIFLTMRGEPVLVDKILKELSPEGFISKNDINFETFPIICKGIIEGDFFRSETIINSQRELFKKNINWDVYDSQILMLIAEGVKTVNIPDFIPLSMSSIEKRKANIKAQLINGIGNDKELIHSAKKLGLI
jgi:DNA-binding NarL/FixJ family response regulator